MSADFSPQMCWMANKQFPGLYLSNIRFSLNGKEEWMFTKEELEDRRKHQYIAVLGCDIYAKLRKSLSKNHFEELNNMLGELVKADEEGSDLSGFPEEVKIWYFNSNRHHYREPNDEAFVEYIEGQFASQSKEDL